MKGYDVIIENVSKKFGDFSVLQNVNLRIKKGEFFSLLGPSGCGKTTLLRMIAGFEAPDEGSILFGDQNICSLEPEKRDCNTVFQNYALFSHLSVYENVAFSLRLKKISEDIIKEKVDHYLKMVQLIGQENKKPHQLSGGQRQRVAIARALINEPSVLLLDEPLSALDAKLRQNLLIELDTIHDKVGITFIYVTHDQSEALSVSDRIAVMDKGQILQVGNPYEIYESPKTNFVAQFIGETNIYKAEVLSSIPFKDEYMVKLRIDALDKEVYVTDERNFKEGYKLSFTLRPEKARITLRERENIDEYTNCIIGIVDEPLYSGFQSKFYVLTKEGATIKVFNQHVNYLEYGPAIQWKDSVFVYWKAEDGYLVDDYEKE